MAQIGIGGKGFNMMWMQFNGLPLTTMSITILAGVVIAFKDGLTPFFEFNFISCDSVPMCFVDVIGKTLALTSFN